MDISLIDILSPIPGGLWTGSIPGIGIILKERWKIMIKKLQALRLITKQDKNTVILFIDDIKISTIHGKNKAELNKKLEKLFENKERLTLFASYVSKFLKDKRTDWISAIYNSYGKKLLISTIPENNENIEEISYTIKFKDNDTFKLKVIAAFKNEELKVEVFDNLTKEALNNLLTVDFSEKYKDVK